jgi:lipid II:glycine glycyltransferase (peptidoglycan interpeptide bridge formation enzyme)
MAVKAVHGIKNIDEEKWEAFVARHPAGNAFQRPDMYRVFEETANYTPYVAAVVDEAGDIKGIMLGVRICNGRSLLCRMTARVIVWGGPLVVDDKYLPLLLRTFTGLVKKDAVYCEIRNLKVHKRGQRQLFEKEGYGYFPHLNIVVDVRKSEKGLMAETDASKRRNIKKAIKEGLIFGKIEKEEEVEEAYVILREVYKKAKLPLSDISLFRALFRKKDICRFYKVSFGDEMAAVMVALINSDNVYEWYVGAKQDFYPKRPNEFLVWNVMLEAKKEGKSFFDFGGAGKPDEEYGVRKFKKGFGGEIVETGRYRIIFDKLAWLLGSTAVKMRKRLK